MATREDVDRTLAEYEPGSGDPDLAGLMRGHLDAAGVGAEPAGEADAAAAVTGADAAVNLPAPERVLWGDAPPPNDAAVCSVGEVGILAAPGGSGKSYLALHLALEAVGGRSPARACGLTVRPGRVLLASYEDSHARLGARLRALTARSDVPADADLAEILLVDDPAPLWAALDDGRGGVSGTAALDAFRRRADADKPSLIVIDPVSAAAAGVNLNEGGAARSCMRDLARLSADTGAGVWLIAHDTKQARNEARAGGNPGAGAVAGSAQWFDAARAVLYLHGAAGGGRMLACEKANHGRAGWGRDLCEVMSGATFQGFESRGPQIADAAAERAAKAKAKKSDRGREKAAFAPGEIA